MSEKMYPIPFKSLMNWVVTEYANSGEIFGVRKAYHATGKSLPIFGERIETPFGPAAGPNSQLAQNIIAAYMAGARFFEVKTVQKMDGEELAACVPRPCILANDEGYNQEWSTELTIPQAMDEYIKAWCALKIMAKELNVPVLCLSQLSRANESRSDKRPMLSDLRESGAIEQDADIVMFLYREGYYDKDTPNPNLAECIIAKNRHGETRTVELQWLPEFTTFSNMEWQHEE